MENKKRKTTSASDSSSNGDNNNGRLLKLLNRKETAKLLECPVCNDMLLPPITLCEGGHAVCSSCQKKCKSCPLCRGPFTKVRNRFAEDLLDKCGVKCKFWMTGCRFVLTGSELVTHHQVCSYRPLICRQCGNDDIPYHSYLGHLSWEEMEPSMQHELDHEVQPEDYIKMKYYDYAGRFSVWEPVWILAHGRNFFCFLDTRNSDWWIWVAGYATPKECEGFTCFIKVYDKDKDTQQTEDKSANTRVHPVGTSPDDVFASGDCLSILDSDLKNRMDKGVVEVMVRIDLGFEDPNRQSRTVVVSSLQMEREQPVKREGVVSSSGINEDVDTSPNDSEDDGDDDE